MYSILTIQNLCCIGTVGKLVNVIIKNDVEVCKAGHVKVFVFLKTRNVANILISTLLNSKSLKYANYKGAYPAIFFFLLEFCNPGRMPLIETFLSLKWGILLREFVFFLAFPHLKSFFFFLIVSFYQITKGFLSRSVFILIDNHLALMQISLQEALFLTISLLPLNTYRFFLPEKNRLVMIPWMHYTNLIASCPSSLNALLRSSTLSICRTNFNVYSFHFLIHFWVHYDPAPLLTWILS